MSLRLTTKNQEKRPISAIYIGKGNLNSASSTTTTTTNTTQHPPTSAPAYITHHRKSSTSSISPGLPDLPEPPSPVLSNSSAGSGLPSPPATNSTGSGSTGDPASITMKNGKDDLLDGDVADDLLDEDTTARMRLAGAAVIGRHAVAAESRESSAMLTRVKNLAERNRQALDKLSYTARPSSVSTRHSRTSSTAPSVHSSSSSQTTSSRSSRSRSSYIPPVTPSSSQDQDQILSGSETEKESTPSLYAHYPNNSSSSLHDYASYPSCAVSSSSSSLTPHSLLQAFSTTHYGTLHAHTPSNGPPAHQTMQQQSQSHSKHHRITSLASASTSYLPSTSHVFQMPQSQAQPLSKTRSTGTNTPSGSSGGTGSSNRMRPVSASSRLSFVSHINGNIGKPREDGSNGSNSPRTRADSTHMQGTILPLTKEETEPTELRRRNTIKTEDKDVAQAALAAVASSRSKTSLDTRRRGTLPRQFRHEVLDEDNYVPDDPITPYRSRNSASRDVLTSTSFARERQPSLRGGSAESALTTRGPTTAGPVGSSRSVISEALKSVGLSPRRNRRFEREKEREKRGDFLVDGDVFQDRKEDWSSQVEKMPIGEFGERRTRIGERDREQIVPQGSRSTTSLSLRRYASRSRSRARTGIGEFSGEQSDDDGVRQDDVTRTAPAGLRAYRHSHTYSTPNVTEREVAHLSLMKKEKERERGKEKERAVVRPSTSLSKHSTPVYQTHTGPSSALKYFSYALNDQERERAVSRQSALASIERTEHVRLMLNSLAMFEGHVSRISSHGRSFNPAHIAELVRTAESVVASADRLNGALRAASKHAVEQEIDAEVADDMEASENEGRRGLYSARDTANMWGAVSADYKEGVKTSDELVRGITTFLLGIGKFLRDVGTSEGGGDKYQASDNGSGSIISAHTRSVSLNDEDVVRSARGISPTLSGGSSGRGGSRRSVDISKKRWETSPLVVAANAREETLRRTTGRSDGAPSVRTSSSVLSEERDQDIHYESPLSRPSSRHNSAFMTPASSRSSTALSNRRSHREQEPEYRPSRLQPSESEDILASTSQDTITPYEPSPSPAPRIRDLSDRTKKKLSPLRTSRPLPSIPSEASLRQQDRTPDHDPANVSEFTNKMHERRKASQTSISTVRGVCTPVSASYPAVLNPSGGGATTAVTTHTVSNASPEGTAVNTTSSSILNSESRRNLRSNITFSKPSTESVPTLAVLQQQYDERQRTTSTSHEPSTPMSGSETERPLKRRTWGVRAGLKGKSELESFEDTNDRVVLGRAADRSAAAMSSVPTHLHPSNSTRNERMTGRRTVTELFPAN